MKPARNVCVHDLSCVMARSFRLLCRATVSDRSASLLVAGFVCRPPKRAIYPSSFFFCPISLSLRGSAAHSFQRLPRLSKTETAANHARQPNGEASTCL